MRKIMFLAASALMALAANAEKVDWYISADVSNWAIGETTQFETSDNENVYVLKNFVNTSAAGMAFQITNAALSDTYGWQETNAETGKAYTLSHPATFLDESGLWTFEMTTPEWKSQYWCETVISEVEIPYAFTPRTENELAYCSIRVGTYDLNWNMADHTMTFVASKGSDSIADLQVSEDGSKAEYYDLSGRRVASPAQGVFIKKQDDTFTKIYVK